MSKVKILLQLLAVAEERGDEQEAAAIIEQVEALQGKQAAAFYRDRPQIMDAMARARREGMVMVRSNGEDILNAH